VKKSVALDTVPPLRLPESSERVSDGAGVAAQRRAANALDAPAHFGRRPARKCHQQDAFNFSKCAALTNAPLSCCYFELIRRRSSIFDIQSSWPAALKPE
jgi:hypothetical protein